MEVRPSSLARACSVRASAHGTHERSTSPELRVPAVLARDRIRSSRQPRAPSRRAAPTATPVKAAIQANPTNDDGTPRRGTGNEFTTYATARTGCTEGGADFAIYSVGIASATLDAATGDGTTD